jgi:hypothetical protein
MKTTSISELKQELQNMPAKEIAELCLRLARFKKENKELLAYLLFEAHDEEAYVESVKAVMDELFKEVNTTNLYYAKKNLRRILRNVNKHIKYSGNKQTEAVSLIHFCTLIKTSGINLLKSTVLQNTYTNQLKKIKAAIETLHDDLQYDLLKEVKKLE